MSTRMSFTKMGPSPRLTSRICLALLVLVAGVGLLPDRTRGAAPPSEKLDCRVYDKKTSKLGLAFKVAQFLFNAGPEISYDAQQGVAWDRTVQSFIVRYVELCERYNTGLVTKAEYVQRLNQMEGLYKEAQQIESQLFEATRNRAKESASELDELVGRTRPREAGGATQASALTGAVNQLALRIEQLEPIGTPLKPAKPCAPPDMLGAPGAQGEADRRC